VDLSQVVLAIDRQLGLDLRVHQTAVEGSTICEQVLVHLLSRWRNDRLNAWSLTAAQLGHVLWRQARQTCTVTTKTKSPAVARDGATAVAYLGFGKEGGHGERVEHEPITGVWGQSPQRGPGADLKFAGFPFKIKLDSFPNCFSANFAFSANFC